ncbi:MAG: transposase [Planctomycetes bacterium]|nr:transposase [Planctomycetota bacterium]
MQHLTKPPGEDGPATQFEFEDSFATEGAWREYLERLRWPDRSLCPRCGHRRPWGNLLSHRP